MDAFLNGIPAIVGDNDPGSGGFTEGLTAIVTGDQRRAKNDGGGYTPLPGVLPSIVHLEYLQKFSAASLLAIALLGLIVLGIVNPARAVRMLTRGAKRQAGVS